MYSHRAAAADTPKRYTLEIIIITIYTAHLVKKIFLSASRATQFINLKRKFRLLFRCLIYRCKATFRICVLCLHPPPRQLVAIARGEMAVITNIVQTE